MKPGAPERHRDGSGRESGRVEGQEAGAGDRGRRTGGSRQAQP